MSLFLRDKQEKQKMNRQCCLFGKRFTRASVRTGVVCQRNLYLGEYFRGISFEAKTIYGMMIDRVSLSIKNGWLDEDGKIYIHYSVADIMADTDCDKNKILQCLKELEEDVIDEIYDLIVETVVGKGGA